MRPLYICIKGLRKTLKIERYQNTEVFKRLGQFTKKLFTQTVTDEIYETILRNQATLEMTQNFDFSF